MKRVGLLRTLVRSVLGAAVAALAVGACGPAGVTPPPSEEGWQGFRDALVYQSGGAALTTVFAQDVDGDDRLDLLTVARGDAVRILSGGAGGGFGPAVRVTAGTDPRQARIADVDGDDTPDLIILGYFDNAVFVRRGLGSGEFAAPTSYALRNHGQQLVTADLNRDGYDDVVTVHDGSGQPVYVTTFLGSATGALEKRWELGTIYTTSKDATLGDFDDDGNIDFALAVGDSRASVLVFRGNGSGDFAEPLVLPPLTTSTPGATDGTESLAAADVNGDGRDDLVVTHHTYSDAVALRLSTGVGFAAPQVIPVTSPLAVAVGPVDADDRVDIVLSHLDDGAVTVMLGLANGSFRAPRRFEAGPAPGALTTADLDTDGRLDVAVVDVSDHRIRVLLNDGP